MNEEEGFNFNDKKYENMVEDNKYELLRILYEKGGSTFEDNEELKNFAENLEVINHLP